MTLLSIIRTVAAEVGIPQPTTVIGNQNANIAQLLALVTREGRHLAKRLSIQELRAEATHTSIAQENQGVITTIAPGFDRFALETFWDRTEQWLLPGPVDAAEWQEMKARGIEPSVTHFRLRGSDLLAYPTPTAGNSWAFEYYTDQWVALYGGGSGNTFANDNDTPKIDETVIEMGVIWRWLKAKGLDYSEEKRDYEIALKQYALTNEARTLLMGQRRSGGRRGDYRVTAAP